jgi:quercetin dioxygenase-like cupin family protein
MRRYSVLIALVTAVTFGLGVNALRDVTAQQGTPAAGGSGVTTTVLGRMPSDLAPGQALALLQVTFAPGGSVAAHTHPGETIYHLAQGTLQFTLLEGEAQLVRAADGVPAAATPTAVESIPVGTELTLTAGDTIYYTASAVQSERNDGDEDAVVLVANLRGLDEPARLFHEGMASPVAGTPAP